MADYLALAISLVGASMLLFRLRTARRPPLGEPLEACDVSIIVPARNEAHNLPTLLESLTSLSPPAREIIVVDDQSTDETSAVAGRYGVTVLNNEPMPPGWIGKSWACNTGARAAQGAYLLFTDADTRHAPDSLARALGELHATKAGLVSLVPTHRVESMWERFQGVFQLLLLVATRCGGRDRAESGARRYAIGQYLLFRRDAYEAMGGHASVSSRLAEDLALAERVADAGYPVHVVFAPRALFVRMYPEGFRAFFAGWRRSFRDGMGAAGPLAVLEMTWVIGFLLGVPLWLLGALLSGRLLLALLWLFAYLMSALLIAREQRHYGAFSGPSALVYPAFVLVFVAVSIATTLDRIRGVPVTWRGRSIPLG